MSRTEPRELLRELQRLEELREPGIAQTQRRFERFVIRADAELLHMDRSIPQQGPVPILLRDLGRAGVGFVSPEPLEVDSTWHLSFLQNGHVIGRQGIVIRHCKPIGESVHLVGGQFCIDSGLMVLLGVHPSDIKDGSAVANTDDQGDDDFLSPEDLAGQGR